MSIFDSLRSTRRIKNSSVRRMSTATSYPSGKWSMGPRLSRTKPPRRSKTVTTQTNGANGLMTTARRISEERRAEVGLSMPALNPDNVPPSVRPLLKHAEILGIGDDVVRGNVFDEVSTQYLDVVRG